MSIATKSPVSEKLTQIAESLDISPTDFKNAVDHYSAVGKWIEHDADSFGGQSPVIYCQGSFRLGTVVRPIRQGRESDFDIDLVCEIQRDKSMCTPQAIKQSVGNRLRENDRYKKMLTTEGKRCWTLEYASDNGFGFHLDVLPSIPSDDVKKSELNRLGVAWEYAQHAIEVTEFDEKLNNYSWASGGSNPKGYAQWFYDQNVTALVQVVDEQKLHLLESNQTLFTRVEDVPEALVRTPLQRAIQLMKRHRDMYFLGHKWEDEKPISIIITTLAAIAYENESDLHAALLGIVNRIETYAESGIIHKIDGQWIIKNPVKLDENFGHKWNDLGSHKADAFFEWIGALKSDVVRFGQEADRVELRNMVGRRFGTSAAESAFPDEVTRSAPLIITSPEKPWSE